MKITAITRYKHGAIYALLQRLHWTQSELARRCQMCPSRIGEIINLRKRPTAEQANLIQRVFGEAGEFLDILSEWPEAFTGLAKGFKHEQTEDVELDRLLDHREVFQIAAPEPDNTEEMDATLDAMLNTLPIRQRQCLVERFFNDSTYSEVSERLGISPGRATQAENSALRKLRHPARIRKLAAVRYGTYDPTDVSTGKPGTVPTVSNPS